MMQPCAPFAGTINITGAKTLSVTSGTFNNNTTGAIQGSGTFNPTGAAFTNNGHIKPGASPGILTITGPLPQTSSSAIDIEIGGPTVGTEYDRLNISGAATLAGTLNISMINNYDLQPGDSFQPGRLG